MPVNLPATDQGQQFLDGDAAFDRAYRLSGLLRAAFIPIAEIAWSPAREPGTFGLPPTWAFIQKGPEKNVLHR